MSDIFREVEEDIRREQLKKLWDRYGVIVIAIAVLIVAGTAGWRGWEWYIDRQAAAAGEDYYQALSLAQRGEQPAAIASFQEIAGGGGPFAPLARLRLAAELAAAGDTEAAVAAYDAMAADSRVEPQLRNLARIRAGYLLVDQAELAELESRVGDLVTPEGAWRHSAREILGLAAYREGDSAAAADHFQEIIADADAPDDLRNRAQLMIALTAADRMPQEGQAATQ